MRLVLTLEASQETVNLLLDRLTTVQHPASCRASAENVLETAIHLVGSEEAKNELRQLLDRVRSGVYRP